MPDIKIGWDEICTDIQRVVGVNLTIRTLQRYVKYYQMPVWRTPSGKPIFSGQLFSLWIEKGNMPRLKRKIQTIKSVLS